MVQVRIPRRRSHGGSVRVRTPTQFYTPQEVGVMTGFSADFIVKEIKAGEIKAVLVQRPGRVRGRWRVAVRDAHDYAVRIGVRTNL